jgi:hypothetical protein
MAEDGFGESQEIAQGVRTELRARLVLYQLRRQYTLVSRENSVMLATVGCLFRGVGFRGWGKAD